MIKHYASTKQIYGIIAMGKYYQLFIISEEYIIGKYGSPGTRMTGFIQFDDGRYTMVNHWNGNWWHVCDEVTETEPWERDRKRPDHDYYNSNDTQEKYVKSFIMNCVLGHMK